MIRTADVPQLLVEVFPAFHLEDEAAAFPKLTYFVVAVFARQAVAVARRGCLDAFPALFSVIERGLQDGDESVQTLLVVGFLESLQAEAIRVALQEGPFDPDLFSQWLGPKTNRAWRELLTAFKGDPADLKAVVQTLLAARDPATMTKAELQVRRRAERAQQRKTPRRKK